MHNKNAYSSKKNYLSASLVILSRPGLTPPELHLLENRDHVDGFQEIKVDGKTSGVITPRKVSKRPSEFLKQFYSIY